MPANVSTLLSTGVSVGIIAGVVSGLFYLVVSGFRWAGEVRLQSSDWFHRRFTTPSRADQGSRNASVMQSESSQVRDFIERLVESLVAGSLDRVNVNRLYSHPAYDRMFESYHDSLCDVLARLSFALQMAIANKPLEDCDSPSSAHAELKQLVQQVVHEAMTLPSLDKVSENGSANGKQRAKETNSKTYEDILATAILNKVIQRCQQCGLGSAQSNSLFNTGDMEQSAFGSCVELGVSRASSVDEASTASLHDASWSDTSQGEPTSLTLEEEDATSCTSSEEAASGRGAELDFYLSGLNFIKRHRVAFPELGMDLVDGGEAGEEEAAPTDLMTPVDSWEENWLFQRRRLKVGGSLQPMAVSMLVPNPSEDFRALIGDQDAEDTEDLSDGSDSIYEGLLEPRPRKMADTQEFLSDTPQATNMDITNDSWSEFGQLDSEYTEDYAAVTQRQMNSLRRDSGLLTADSSRPVPKPRTQVPAEAGRDVVDDSPAADCDQDDDLASPPRPGSHVTQDTDSMSSQPMAGTIAEREHRKWESAPPLPNNPYSSENIMKRLNKSSRLDIRPTRQEQVELTDQVCPPTSGKASTHLPDSVNIARYGRDYYVNESKSPHGSNGVHPIQIVPLTPTEQPLLENKSTEKPEKSLRSVGNTVTQWQAEINQREELWRKNASVNKKETNPHKANNLGQTPKKSPVLQSGKNNLKPQTKEIIIIEKPMKSELLLLNETILIVDSKQSPSALEKSLAMNELNNPVTKNDVKCAKSKLWENHSKQTLTKQENDKVRRETTLLNGSDGKRQIAYDKKASEPKNKLTSTDDDKATIINMPSVKDLAKQFTARNEDRPQTPPSHKAAPATKKALGLHSGPPMREVHSLTARSISREFREELRRNLPPPLRNTPGSECSASRSTTPGDTSDDSSAASGSLRNNIAFWEQMKHK